MEQQVQSIDYELNRLQQGGTIYLNLVCSECKDTSFPISIIVDNHTSRDEALNHMMAHFYAES